MCGRMNVESKHSKLISEFFGCDFNTSTNNNLSPGQTVTTLISHESSRNQPSKFEQFDTTWGIKPSWSKRLLINAQSETVLTKATFKDAIKTHRCLIPCSGWYEWRTEAGKKKKYLFSHVNDQPFLMAGIWYQNSGKDKQGREGPDFEPENKLVTLTTAPNVKCGEYHQRMPVIILPQYRDFWFQSSTEQLAPLFTAVDQSYINVSEA